MSSTKATRALLVHGSYGSPDSSWLPWLRGRLEAAGLDTFAPVVSDAGRAKSRVMAQRVR